MQVSSSLLTTYSSHLFAIKAGGGGVRASITPAFNFSNTLLQIVCVANLQAGKLQSVCMLTILQACLSKFIYPLTTLQSALIKIICLPQGCKWAIKNSEAVFNLVNAFCKNYRALTTLQMAWGKFLWFLQPCKWAAENSSASYKVVSLCRKNYLLIYGIVNLCRKNYLPAYKVVNGCAQNYLPAYRFIINQL